MITIKNQTTYPTREVSSLVRKTFRLIECDHVDVTVRFTRGEARYGGRYYDWWRPSRGEHRERISIRLPRPEVDLSECEYLPYKRTREQGRTFPMRTWQEILVTIAAHEGWHHKQRYQGGKYTEVECDLAAFRAWNNFKRRES